MWIPTATILRHSSLHSSWSLNPLISTWLLTDSHNQVSQLTSRLHNTPSSWLRPSGPSNSQYSTLWCLQHPDQAYGCFGTCLLKPFILLTYYSSLIFTSGSPRLPTHMCTQSRISQPWKASEVELKEKTSPSDQVQGMASQTKQPANTWHANDPFYPLIIVVFHPYSFPNHQDASLSPCIFPPLKIP